jgi:hypothetical protein
VRTPAVVVSCLIVASLFGGTLAWAQRPLREEVVTFSVDGALLVDGKSVKASAIWQMTAARYLSLGPTPVHLSTRGQALRFVLPNGTALYLLRRDPKASSSLGFGAFPTRCVRRNDGDDSFFADLASWTGPCEIDLPPLAVTFRDELEPETIERVPLQPAGPDCLTLCLNLVVRRSEGLAVTTGIEAHLPWLVLGSIGAEIGTGDDRGGNVGGFPDRFYNIDFSTEIARQPNEPDGP